MTQTIHFTKMHGAGNDYIYVNTLLYNIPDPEQAAKVWSAPHTGIGSDGLVLIGAPKDAAAADFSMRIFNADGSEALMCGNASRCIAKYLYERGMTKAHDIRLETLSGVKVLHLNMAADGTTLESVTVDMLEPKTDVPEQYDGTHLRDRHPDVWQAVGATDARFVSMGNPHYVIFVKDVAHIDITRYGSALETDPMFPQRCNIEFAELRTDGTIRTRVWERGSGITMACGTGACATAVAAHLCGLTGREADVVMDGGVLHIAWQEDNHVMMTGPAAVAFEGEIALP